MTDFNPVVTGGRQDILLCKRCGESVGVCEFLRRSETPLQRPPKRSTPSYKNLTYAPFYYGIRDKKKLEKIVEETLKLTGLYEEVTGELHKSA